MEITYFLTFLPVEPMNSKVNAVLRMRRFIINLPEFMFFLSNLILDSFMAWERIDPGGGEPSFSLRSTGENP